MTRDRPAVVRIPSRTRRNVGVQVRREDVALVALTLFLDHGYDEVTMEDVADVADISRHALRRLYPTKAAIVLDELSACAERLRAALVEVPTGVPVPDALRAAYRAAGDVPEHTWPGTRLRLRVISTQPALSGEVESAVQSLVAPTASWLRARDHGSSDGLRACVVAHLLATTLLAALAWWAFRPEEHPRAVVDRAIGIALGPIE